MKPSYEIDGMAASKIRLESQGIGLIVAKASGRSGLRVGGTFRFRAYRAGALLWEDHAHNIVTNEGLEHLINGTIAGATQITQWYVYPTGSAPTPAAGTTYANQTGATEATAYDEGTRQTYDEADNGVGALSNTASPATLTISATVTIGGAAIVGGGSAPTTKSNTAGGGTLLCAVAFTGGDRALVDNDVLEITYNISIADDGA